MSKPVKGVAIIASALAIGAVIAILPNGGALAALWLFVIVPIVFGIVINDLKLFDQGQ